jgi:hypothetical protein
MNLISLFAKFKSLSKILELDAENWFNNINYETAIKLLKLIKENGCYDIIYENGELKRTNKKLNNLGNLLDFIFDYNTDVSRHAIGVLSMLYFKYNCKDDSIKRSLRSALNHYERYDLYLINSEYIDYVIKSIAEFKDEIDYNQIFTIFTFFKRKISKSTYPYIEKIMEKIKNKLKENKYPEKIIEDIISYLKSYVTRKKIKEMIWDILHDLNDNYMRALIFFTDYLYEEKQYDLIKKSVIKVMELDDPINYSPDFDYQIPLKLSRRIEDIFSIICNDEIFEDIWEIIYSKLKNNLFEYNFKCKKLFLVDELFEI